MEARFFSAMQISPEVERRALCYAKYRYNSCGSKHRRPPFPERHISIAALYHYDRSDLPCPKWSEQRTSHDLIHKHHLLISCSILPIFPVWPLFAFPFSTISIGEPWQVTCSVERWENIIFLSKIYSIFRHKRHRAGCISGNGNRTLESGYR